MNGDSYNNHGAIRSLRSIAFLLSLAAFGQLITAFVSLGKTSGIFNGGFWTGIICLLLCSSILRKHASVAAFQCLSFSCLLAFISSCVSTAILNGEIALLKDTVTCVSSCSNGICDVYGSKATHDVAIAKYCHSSFSEYSCNCYTTLYASDDDVYNNDQCINYDMANCGVIFNELPTIVRVSYGFSLCCLVLSFMLMITSCSIVYVPRYRESIIIIDEGSIQQPIYVVSNPTYQSQPVYVTATATTSPVYIPSDNVTVEPYVQAYNPNSGSERAV